MSDSTSAWGSVRREGTRVRVTLSRDIEHSRDRVWEMLTDSACLAKWLAPGYIEQRPGGMIKLDFGMSGTPIEGPVKAIVPFEILEYSWSAGSEPERPMRWQLSPAGAGTLLQLTLDLPDDDKVALSCAGWDAHLEMLMAALEGISIHFPKDRFQEARLAFSQLTEATAA